MLFFFKHHLQKVEHIRSHNCAITYNSNYYVLMILVYFKYIFQGYLVLLCLLLSLNVYVYNIINKLNSIEIG